MNQFVAKVIEAYPEPQRLWIVPTRKSDVLARLDELRKIVEGIDELDRFPEGPSGVVLLALLMHGAGRSPDGGDFGHLVQGYKHLFKASEDVLGKNWPWLHKRPRSDKSGASS